MAYGIRYEVRRRVPAWVCYLGVVIPVMLLGFGSGHGWYLALAELCGRLIRG